MSEAERLADLLERDPSEWGGLSLGWGAAAPPAPQADKYVPCPHCGKNTASDNPSQWCPCPKQASVVQKSNLAAAVEIADRQAKYGLAPHNTHPAPQAKPLSNYEWDEVG